MNTYKILLKKIYLQNYIDATTLQVIIFSSSGYSQQRIKLLKKKALEVSSVTLKVLGEFTLVEFRIMNESTLLD